MNNYNFMIFIYFFFLGGGGLITLKVKSFYRPLPYWDILYQKQLDGFHIKIFLYNIKKKVIIFLVFLNPKVPYSRECNIMNWRIWAKHDKSSDTIPNTWHRARTKSTIASPLRRVEPVKILSTATTTLWEHASFRFSL